MKKIAIYLFAAMLLSFACAKSPVTSPNDAAKAYFDAWVEINNDGSWQTTPLGVYIMEDEPGTGAEVLTDTTGNHYLWVDYYSTTLKGSLTQYTYEWAFRQMNTYAEYYYYGPRVWQRGENTMYAGIEDALIGMKEGGRRKFAVPAWLGVYARHSGVQAYLDAASGTAAIYDVKLAKIIPELHDWEADSVWHTVHRLFPEKAYKDSIVTGMYYIRTKAPSSEGDMPTDTTVYINYIGRCLDGRVFDTNIRDTAVFYGVWNASRTYGPISIKWAEKVEDLKMDGSSSLIRGFAEILKQMHPDEAGTGMFCSSRGYGSSGSGSAIPPFSPLRFDIELCAAK